MYVVLSIAHEKPARVEASLCIDCGDDFKAADGIYRDTFKFMHALTAAPQATPPREDA